MKKRVLGRTGLEISEIGLGTWPIAGNSYGPTDDAESKKLIQYAYNAGCNFFDTADVYGVGHSESLIGSVLNQKDYVVLSKVGWEYSNDKYRKRFDAAWIQQACQTSLKRLQRDFLDIYLLHNPSFETMQQQEDLFEPLKKLKQKGLIRFFGCSIHEAEEGLYLIDRNEVDVIEVIVNLIDHRAIQKLFSAAAENNIGIIAREPFACGLLTDKYHSESRFTGMDHRKRWKRAKIISDLEIASQLKRIFQSEGLLEKFSFPQLALFFVLSYPEISSVIPGCKTLAQAKENFAICNQFNPLSSKLIKLISELISEAQSARPEFFPN